MASVALLVSVPRASKYKPKKKNHKREIRQKTSRLLKSMDMPVMLMGYFTFKIKSAHTALAVKACLLGGNSNTKCSMTFVNIAVAISALAGGAKTVSHRDQNTVVFSTFFEDFWVSERKRVLKWNFGSFW